MALSKREKNIAIAVGVTAVLFVLNEVIIEPYTDALDDIKKQTDSAIAQQKANDALFNRQTELKGVWDNILINLQADESAAESQALNKALDWAQTSGVNITAVKPERTTTAKEFEVIGFHLTGTGSTPAIGRLLAYFETARIPVRVDDMTIAPRKEGTDDLTIQLSLSTLCLKPAADSAPKTIASIEDSRGQL